MSRVNGFRAMVQHIQVRQRVRTRMIVEYIGQPAYLTELIRGILMVAVQMGYQQIKKLA